MQFIKVDLSVYETQLQALNNDYIANLPQGSTTTNYANPFIFNGFGYVIMDSYTLPFFPDYIEVVNSLPLWHDETKSIQIIQSNDDCLNMIGDYPEIAVYRKDNNIETIRDNELVYVYVNTLLPEHRALLEQYNAQINEK